MPKRSDQIAALRAQGCNCCQVVLRSFEDQVDVSREELMRFGAGFGGGMGSTFATCGALCAAQMLLGLKLYQGSRINPDARAMLEAFREKCGAVTCREIKGLDTGKPLIDDCKDCIRIAIELLIEKGLYSE